MDAKGRRLLQALMITAILIAAAIDFSAQLPVTLSHLALPLVCAGNGFLYRETNRSVSQMCFLAAGLGLVSWLFSYLVK